MAKKSRRTLSAELYEKTTKAAGLTFEEEDGEFIRESGEVLGRYQAIHIPLHSAVEYDDELIDEVLIFGDGCIELHDCNSQDAYNWDDYPNEVLSGVVDNIIIN